MDLDELKILLASSNVKTVIKSLTEIRTKVMKSESGIAKLLENGFVALLVPLLDKTNMRLLDLALSILANLLLEPQARQQIVEEGGLQKLTAILQNIEVQDKSFDDSGFKLLTSFRSQVCSVEHGEPFQTACNPLIAA